MWGTEPHGVAHALGMPIYILLKAVYTQDNNVEATMYKTKEPSSDRLSSFEQSARGKKLRSYLDGGLLSLMEYDRLTRLELSRGAFRIKTA